jgi:ABC-type multidrug transport system fused ATPase/permease subunit
VKLKQCFDFAMAHRKAILTYSAITFLASLLESVGLITLIPLLAIVSNKNIDEGNKIINFAENIFNKLNLEPTFDVLIFIIISISLISILLKFSAKLYTGYTQNKIMTDFRMKLINSIKEVGWSFYANLSSGYLLNLIMRETLLIGKYFTSICNLLSMVFQILSLAFIVIVIDPQIIIMLLTAAIIMFSTLSFIVGRTGLISKKLV